MRKTALRNAFAVGAAVAATAAVVAATLMIPASADDSPGQIRPEPDPVAQKTLDQIYSAKGVVRRETPITIQVPALGDFGFGDSKPRTPQEEFERAVALERERQKAIAKAEKAINKIRSNIKSKLDGSEVEVGRPEDPMFQNYEIEDGSGTVESGGQNSSTTTESGASYNVTQAQDGGVTAEYSAHARVQGTNTDVSGSWSFVNVAGGGARTFGQLKIDSFAFLTPDGDKLKLKGTANVVGSDGYSVNVGATSYSVGLTAADAKGNEVGMSVAVSADGTPMNISFGGQVTVEGLPQPVMVRVDVNPTSGNVTGSAQPVPGLELSADSGGAFRLQLNMNTFLPWLSNTANGK